MNFELTSNLPKNKHLFRILFYNSSNTQSGCLSHFPRIRPEPLQEGEQQVAHGERVFAKRLRVAVRDRESARQSPPGHRAALSATIKTPLVRSSLDSLSARIKQAQSDNITTTRDIAAHSGSLLVFTTPGVGIKDISAAFDRAGAAGGWDSGWYGIVMGGGLMRGINSKRRNNVAWYADVAPRKSALLDLFNPGQVNKIIYRARETA